MVRGVDRFVVFSTAERMLYSEEFGLPEERIEMLHWGIVPPEPDIDRPPLVEGEYITAIGRTGRNYADFIDAMRRLPDLKAVVIASPQCIDGMEAPPNVVVKYDIPYADMLNVLQHSRMMALPLQPSDVPYGHGTAVLAMHLQRPVVATAGLALADYIRDGETGLTFPAGDPDALADQISRLVEDSDLAAGVAARAYTFAQENCTEAAMVSSVIPILRDTRRIGA